MPSLKDLKNRIASVKSTRKITSAMKMVAASKLRRAQEQAEAARPYALRMASMLKTLAANLVVTDKTPRLLTGVGKEQTVLFLVVTSDRGLCGGFNGNIVRETRRQVRQLEADGKQVKLYFIGRKGRDVLRREFADKIIGMMEISSKKQTGFIVADTLMNKLIAMYEAGEFDVLNVVYNRFKSVISQVVTIERLIPVQGVELARRSAGAQKASQATEKAVKKLTPDQEEELFFAEDPEEPEEPEVPAEEELRAEIAQEPEFESEELIKAEEEKIEAEFEDIQQTYNFEPKEEDILMKLLPHNLATQIYATILESTAGEQGARMTAMDSATRNAGDMIDKLTLNYNRSRQAYITKELIEIISGAEAAV